MYLYKENLRLMIIECFRYNKITNLTNIILTLILYYPQILVYIGIHTGNNYLPIFRDVYKIQV